MKLSDKGANILDQLCHTIYQQDFPPLKSGISCGKCGHELKTYYCEERLYIVECEHCGVKCLVQAGSPAQACYKTMAYPVGSVEDIAECEAVFWDHIPIDDPPIYVGSTADCDFPKNAVCGMELPCCGTDGMELE